MNKYQKRNVVAMGILILLFIIGIIIRWDFVSSEVTSSIDALFNR